MSDINITLYDILDNINDSIKKDDTSGIRRSKRTIKTKK